MRQQNTIIADPERLLRLGQYSHEELAQLLIDVFFADLHLIAYSILGNSAAADDVVQESYIKALQKIDHYELGTNLKTWLITIVVNSCRDKLRKRHRRQRWQGIWESLQRQERTLKTPERQIMDQENENQLWAAVRQLGEKHRLPIILRYVHDLSIRQIAEILRVPEGTIHSRLYHACNKLGRILNAKNDQARYE